jgi:hypothetical protein
MFAALSRQSIWSIWSVNSSLVNVIRQIPGSDPPARNATVFPRSGRVHLNNTRWISGRDRLGAVTVKARRLSTEAAEPRPVSATLGQVCGTTLADQIGAARESADQRHAGGNPLFSA